MIRLGLAILICWTSVHAVAEDDGGDTVEDAAYAAFPVVATYEELAAAPRHPLPEKGGTVQLGIEARTVPWGRGCLVYCRSEAPVGGTGRGEILGPVSLVVRRPVDEILFQVHDALAGPDPDGPEVYATAIGFPEPGEYRLVVSDGDREIAATRIRVTDEVFHFFVPFGALPDSREHVREDAGEVVADLEPRWEMPGRPRFDGMVPLAVPGDDAPDADAQERELPGSFPRRPDHGLTISRRGDGSLVLESDEDLPLVGVDDRLLARWWVDGDPVVQRISRMQVELRDRTGRAVSGRRIVIRPPTSSLPGGPAAREIGVQILHCPNGWEFALQEEGLAQLAVANPARLPRLSNRITWNEPADDED